MPVIKQVDREEFNHVLMEPHLAQRLLDNFLDASYFTEDEAGEKRVDPGLVVAQETNTKKYVPYNASGLYGTGSDTAVGVLDKPYFVTHDDVAVAPVYHGKLIEAHCYVWGVAEGTISGTIKSALNMIEWV